MLGLIAGVKGSGKSVRLHELLKNLNRLLVFDPMGEHTSLGTVYAENIQHAAVTETLGDELGLLAGVPSLLMQAIGILAGRPLRSLWRPLVPEVISPMIPEPADPVDPDVDRVVVQDPDDIDWFLGGLCEMADGYTVAIDEALLFWHHPLLAKQIFTMRHRRQDWWLVTQRLAKCPHEILSQLDRVMIFNMWWPPDLDMLLERFGIDPEAVAQLKVGECIDKQVNAIGDAA